MRAIYVFMYLLIVGSLYSGGPVLLRDDSLNRTTRSGLQAGSDPSALLYSESGSNLTIRPGVGIDSGEKTRLEDSNGVLQMEISTSSIVMHGDLVPPPGGVITININKDGDNDQSLTIDDVSNGYTALQYSSDAQTLFIGTDENESSVIGAIKLLSEELTLVADDVTIEGSDVSVSSTSGDTSIESQSGGITISADGDLDLESNSSSINIVANSNVYLESASSYMEMLSNGEINVEADDNIRIRSFKDMSLDADDEVSISFSGLDVMKVYKEGHFSVPESPSLITPGAAGEASIFVNAGALSVRHALGSIVSLESPTGLGSAEDKIKQFSFTGQSTAATIAVASIDTGDPGFEPVGQGAIAVVAEIVAGEDGAGIADSGFYSLKAWVTAFNNELVPPVIQQSSSDNFDGDGAGGKDCVFAAANGLLNLNCNGYNNYKGFLRFKSVSSGPN